MNIIEIFIGFIVYTSIIYIWYSPIFFGKLVIKLNYGDEIHKELYSKTNLILVFMTSLVSVFCFHKLISYSALNPYSASFLIWVGFFLPILIWFVSLGRVGKAEAIICGNGFLVALIGLASVYSIF